MHWNGIQKTYLLSYCTSRSEQAENSLVLPTVCFKYITINLNHNRIPWNPVCAPQICIVEIKNGKYDNEMCE